MASDVDICNLALARLGDEANVTSISPADGGMQAEHCARFYPLALSQILGAYPWRFAIKRQTLARLAAEPVGGGYAFPLPSDCVTVLEAHVDDEGLTEHFMRTLWTIEQQDSRACLVWKHDTCWIRYTSAKTPASLFPSDFVDALAWLLASHLAGPVMPGATGVQVSQSMREIYEATVQRAMANDARQLRLHEGRREDFLGDYWDRGQHDYF
ncbi:hypothetical protein [Sutterella sp.]|uniref:hypothetical protein n=1 Tax=Sutterella sp. TaxID=1981025 RepID=UPI0026E0C90D|nr:hypothetical protein [Sutterella sp.]MDO5531063.1 hypothetical protein [Sutterella sp.]